MALPDYDIITVGGGLGGAALAKTMAENGVRVLVLERETEFKDRVRGEGLMPWGAAEAGDLGLLAPLLARCGHEHRWFDTYRSGDRAGHRDLIATTPKHTPGLGFFHPAMQETVLAAAREAGAEVRRGARVLSVRPGLRPTLDVEQDGRIDALAARLVVIADGRRSASRTQAGFVVHRDPDATLIAGVLVGNCPAPDDAVHLAVNPDAGHIAILFPQGHGRVRAYFVSTTQWEHRLSGPSDMPAFIARSIEAGMPAEFYAGLEALGPLATFEGAPFWVDHPYRDGVAVIGDAAAASDPSHGQGLSLALRDVRVLRDQLLSSPDWEAAGHAYAAAHDRYYGVLHTYEGWFTDLFLRTGPEAAARRARALPLQAKDRTRRLDVLVSGPDAMLDETARRRFFGEE